MSVNACQRAYSIYTHTQILEQYVPDQFVVRGGPMTHKCVVNSDNNNGLSLTGVNKLM